MVELVFHGIVRGSLSARRSQLSPLMRCRPSSWTFPRPTALSSSAPRRRRPGIGGADRSVTAI